MAAAWYPMINYEKCIECGACVDMCPNGVYDKEKHPRPAVVFPGGCVQGCKGCGSQCPSGAIEYFGDTGGNAEGCGCDCGCGGNCGQKKEDHIVQTLTIEWRHLDAGGETCSRCYDTGENLANEVKRLRRTLEPKGIEIVLKETKLDDSQISQSNTVLFNGVPIEAILDIGVSENYCDSCTALLGKTTYCRAVTFEGAEYEDIPAKAIRKAANKALGLQEEHRSASGGCGCSGNCGC